MNQIILLVGVVIMICVLMGRVTSRLAVPSLLIFIGLGMLFGEDGIFRIVFDDYGVTETICSVSLIFIIFYGGFGTNVKEAKSVAAKALLLSTLGVALTTGFVGVFVHLVLRLPWLESFLVGSVIASTDAASVFNILRTKKLDLKYHTASLLELESGSNDPRKSSFPAADAGAADRIWSCVRCSSRASGCLGDGPVLVSDRGR